MNYSFCNYPINDIKNKTKEYEKNRVLRDQNLQYFIKKYELIELKSNYLDIRSYFYDPKKFHVWYVEYENNPYIRFDKPEYNIYMDLLNYNNLKWNIYSYNNQPNNLC
jgi:hypothetical protein